MNNKEISDLIEDLKTLQQNIENEVDSDFNNQIENLLVKLNQETSINFNTSLNINIKKLNPNAVIPKYSKNGDAGMDLTAIRIVEETDDKITYGTGLALEIPEHYAGLILPRSSIKNTDLLLTNPPGLIDSGYRGEIMLVFYKINGANTVKKYNVNERIGQILILPYPNINFNEVDNLSVTERGTGGYGSTGK